MMTMLPSAQDDIQAIRSALDDVDIYNQLAEEASELAQAASKMVRVLKGSNPTPVNKEEAIKQIVEEYTDVVNVASNILDIHPNWLIGDYKLHRWRKRLEETRG